MANGEDLDLRVTINAKRVRFFGVSNDDCGLYILMEQALPCGI